MLKIADFVDLIWGASIKIFEVDTFETIWEGKLEDSPKWIDKFEICSIENLREGDETYPIVFKVSVPAYILKEMKEENVTWDNYGAWVERNLMLENRVHQFQEAHPNNTCTVDEWDHYSDIYKDAYGIRPSSEYWEFV